jgi:peroxiredoxin
MLGVGDVVESFKSYVSDKTPCAVFFYKNDCPTCQFAFQYLPKIANDLGNKNFLAIAQDSLYEVEIFKKKYKVEFEMLSDPFPFNLSRNLFGISTVPTGFVVESDFKISDVGEGFDRKFIERFTSRIAKLNQIENYQTFKPTEYIPLLKPG